MLNRFKNYIGLCNSLAIFILLLFGVRLLIEKYNTELERHKINSTEKTAAIMREKAELAHLRSEELKYNLLLRQYDYFEYKEDMGEDE